MDALESPFEVLAFNYLSYGFLTAVNSIWAWVAVLTAAVSFWRMRSSLPTAAGLGSAAAPGKIVDGAAVELANIFGRIRPSSKTELGSTAALSGVEVGESAAAEPTDVFWRIRSSSKRELDSAATLSLSKVTDGTTAELARVLLLGNSEAMSKASFRVLEREGSTKTKFSLYFEEGREFRENDGGVEREDGGDEVAVGVSEKWWCDDWERMMAMRMGDMGWYKWQDTTALDGGVVRLWEGRRRRGAAAELVVDGGVVGGMCYRLC